MSIFWIIAYSVLATLFIAALAYACVLFHKAMTEDIPNTDALHKEEYVKKSDIIDMYENDFPNLDDEVHWSRSDIINNLDAVPSYSMTPLECQEVRPVTHSHWVHHKGEYHDYVSCARCGEPAKCAEMADCVLWKYSTYCSDCGSLMDEEIEEVEE